MKSFDLVVVGTGSAGSSAAFGCREAGWNVAIVDERPFGGTCELRGCDPKKVLVAAEELADWGERFRRLGVVDDTMGIDWAGLMRFKDTFTSPAPMRKEGVCEGRHRSVPCVRIVRRRIDTADWLRNRARPQPCERDERADATARHPRRRTAHHQRSIAQSRSKRIVMVGGGYIAFEFAHVAARAGASVTIVHQGARPLEQFDAGLVDVLVRATRDLGIDIRLNTSVRSIERRGDMLAIGLGDDDGATSFIEAEMAVHGAGRAPDLDSLALKAAGIAANERGVAVNKYLQSTSISTVYAAGDAADTGQRRLTPVAGAEGDIVAANLLKGGSRTVSLGPVPSIVFTTPALGAVGLTEAEATRRGLRFKTNHADTTQWYSSRRVSGARRRSRRSSRKKRSAFSALRFWGRELKN